MSTHVFLDIYGEASDDPPTFGGVNDISNRPKTLANETWIPADWTGVGDTGPAQKTINIASIISGDSRQKWLYF